MWHGVLLIPAILQSAGKLCWLLMLRNAQSIGHGKPDLC